MSVFETTNNGKQVWCASFWYTDDSGKRRFIRGYGETVNEAVKRRTANFTKTMQSGLNGPRRATSPKVKDYLHTWMQSPAYDRLGPESQRKYRRDIEIHILPHIGDQNLESLTETMLTDLFYVILKDSPTSARWHAFKTFGIMLNFAVKAGVIARSPLAGVVAPTRTTTVSGDDDRYNDARLRIAPYYLKWLARPDNEFHEHYNRMYFMFLGLRRAEILGLDWSCVNNLNKRGDASLIIRQQLTRHEKHTGKSGWYIKNMTKSKKDRKIPLPESWRLRLLDEKKKGHVATEGWASNLIFLTPKGSHVTYNLHAEKWRESLTAYMTKDGPSPLDDFYFRPHAVRHLAASMMFEDGVPLEVAQQILGHSDKAVTQHYTHLSREKIRRATESLGKGFAH